MYIDAATRREANAKNRKLTLFERQRLMHKHRCNESGSIVQRYLPYYQYGFPELLRECRREQLWEQIDKIVRRVERGHFKQIRQPEEYHINRILAFYELAEARWDMTPAWIITSYTRGFSEIEGLLQLRRIGVSLAEYDKNYNDEIHFPILQYRRWFCRVFVQYFIIERRKLADPSYDYVRLYYEETGRYPNKKAMRLWDERVAVLRQAINMSTELVFGFGSPRSLDDDARGVFYEFDSNREADTFDDE